MGFVSKEYRKEFVKACINNLKKLNLSEKTIGFFMRAYHVNMPIYFFIVMIYGSRIMNTVLLVFLLCALVSFFAFDGCILSKIESEIDAEDITVVDPLLEIFHLNVDNENRMFISIIVAGLYLSLAFSIYFIRFGITYPAQFTVPPFSE
jgi:hypothetical protein